MLDVYFFAIVISILLEPCQEIGNVPVMSEQSVMDTPLCQLIEFLMKFWAATQCVCSDCISTPCINIVFPSQGSIFLKQRYTADEADRMGA